MSDSTRSSRTEPVIDKLVDAYVTNIWNDPDDERPKLRALLLKVRNETAEACARLAETQAPDCPEPVTDEYRRGQIRGARDAATMIRRQLSPSSGKAAP